MVFLIASLCTVTAAEANRGPFSVPVAGFNHPKFVGHFNSFFVSLNHFRWAGLRMNLIKPNLKNVIAFHDRFR